MKNKIINLLENNIIFRPALWAAFIYFGERNLSAKRKAAKEIKPISQLERSRLSLINKWNEINGENTVRLQYELNENSIVFDVGGFEGNWSAEIFTRYGSFICVFEPYIPFYKKIEVRFRHNNKIHTFPFGLGSENHNVLFYGGGDRSSVFKMTDIEIDNEEGTEVKMIDIIDFIEKEKYSKIDLIKLNIEGGEYALLERLIEKKSLTLFENLQIQFHDIDPSSKARMRSIQKELSKTHTITYQYEFIWENWKKNPL